MTITFLQLNDELARQDKKSHQYGGRRRRGLTDLIDQ